MDELCTKLAALTSELLHKVLKIDNENGNIQTLQNFEFDEIESSIIMIKITTSQIEKELMHLNVVKPEKKEDDDDLKLLKFERIKEIIEG